MQVVQGEMYQERASNQQTRSTILAAKRGEIYDRNMNNLVRSATVWNVCISPAEMTSDPQELDKIAAGLSEILDIDKSVVIEGAADKSKYYLRIKRRIELETYQKVLDFITSNDRDTPDIKGVFFELDTKRYYKYDSLASTVIGFTNFDNQGAYGIESYYNKILSGTAGVIVSAKNALGSDMNFKYSQANEAKDGNSIVLTIDEAIQHVVERNLEVAIVEHDIKERCTGIVMNVKTGEILAMSTKPDFDPNEPDVLKNPLAIAELEQFELEFSPETQEYRDKLQQLRYDQWRNKAISDTYEPGSVFKIVTAATGIDNSVVTLNDNFYCSGGIKVSSHTYGCWRLSGHGSQDFTKAMQNSCNPAFITIGQRIGAPLFQNYLEGFGFGETSGIDLPGEAKGILQDYELLSKPGMVELSSTSFGQTFKITALQMITAASASVNGGYLMKPFVVKQTLDVDGNVLSTTQPTVRRQVISEQTSKTVRELVASVVNGGSGRSSAVPGYTIGGKTGTSEKMDVADKVYVLSFVGFAPMDDPQYAILITLDEPDSRLQDMYGSTIAAPVVGAIFQEILPYLGLEPQFTTEELSQRDAEVPELIGLKPHDAQSMLTERGLRMRIEGNGPSIIRQIPQAWQSMPKGGTVIVFTDDETMENEIAIPELVGLPAREANAELLNKGLNVELRGVTEDGASTVVGEQWPLPGTVAQTGDVVVITLVERPAEPVIPVDAGPEYDEPYDTEPTDMAAG
ncbi:MAG: penicillin-binding transpeptidase domain-containing protein [Oscillospiraceae bacterium]|nr:penicillin-binding transpeptidase domain-containing protein [Oscillospiraceae bacterium]